MCVCVCTLSPLRISTPISPTPIPGVGSSRRGIRVHGPRLKHLYNYCWRDTIDGKRLYSLSVDVSVNTVMAGQGERPSGSNQLPAWAVCLLFTTPLTSWYSWTWSTTRECGLGGDDERWGFSKAYGENVAWHGGAPTTGHQGRTRGTGRRQRRSDTPRRSGSWQCGRRR